MTKKNKIYIAGHRGMFGSALCRTFIKNGYENLLLASRSDLNLLDQFEVNNFFNLNRPEILIIAAARVGGINANISFPYEFLQENLQIQNNLISSAFKYDIKKIVFLGSSCIYPRETPQPMKESQLLSGKLEPTNEGYALAKIAGLKTCEFLSKQYGLDTLSIMPCNLYGPNDSFDLKHAHVLSSLVKKIYDAKVNLLPSITLWGTGKAKRELMHVDDAAEATLFLIKNYKSHEFINVGIGLDLSIFELSEIIKSQIGYDGEIKWDNTKPDGMPRKCLNISKLNNLGFRHKIPIEKGIKQMIKLYKKTKL